MKQQVKAYCSECFDGEIVRDKNAPEIFFCNACYRNVTIKVFDGDGRQWRIEKTKT